MAWGNLNTLGSNQEKVNDTSLTLAVTAAAEVGNVIVVLVAFNNVGTVDGDNNAIASVTDAAGNTYTKAREFENAQGGAAAGAGIVVYFSKVSTQLNSGALITVTFNANNAAKAMSAWEFSIGAGNVVSVQAGADLANDGADPASMDLSVPNAEFLWVRAVAKEGVVGTYTKTVAYGSAFSANGTGLNNVRVVATGANGYLTATNYSLVITTGTVGGTSVVGYVVGSFSIEKRSAVIPTTAARTLDVDAAGGVEVGSFQAGAITAAAFTAGAVDNAAFNVTETLNANPTAGGIVAASFAAGAIDAAALATDAIGAAEFSQAAADKVWSSATRTLTAFSTALAVAVWDVLETAIAVASSIGLKVKNNLDAAITTRLAPTVAARTLDVAVGGEAGIDLDNTVGTLAKTTDITGFNDLSAAQVNAEVDTALDTAIPAVNVADSVNDILLDRTKPNLDVVVSTRATPAQVNTEVLDVLNTDTFAEPAQGIPAATNTVINKISFLYKFLRNRITQDATTLKIYNDDAVTVDQKATISDSGSEYVRGEIGTGP